MTDYLDTGVAAQVLDLQIIARALRGDAVATGVAPSHGTNALETEVTAGTTFVDGVPLTFASTGDQSAIHDGGGTDPRRDVVYISNVTGDAVLDIVKGTPGAAEHAQGDDTVNFADAPFEFSAPAPPTMADIPGTPVAEVAIPAGATDYTEATHLRDLRLLTDVYSDAIDVLSDLLLPEYDNVNNATATEGSLLWATGNGTSAEGLYVYDGASYVKLGEDVTITDLVIDANRDWGGFNITNVGTMEATDVMASEDFRVAGGRGSFSLPDQHARYAAGITDTEIARWSLQTGEILECTLLEVTHKGGGSDANFTVQLYDESAAAGIVSTSDSVRPDPPAASSAGADVSLLVTNGTGAAVDATISGQMFRVTQG